MKDFAKFSITIWITCITLSELLFPCCALTPNDWKHRILKEYDLISSYPNHFTANFKSQKDISLWECTMEGPKGTPYDGGNFKIEIKFTDKYPSFPPKVTFITYIYHQNVKSTGEVSLNILKGGWKENTSVLTILNGLYNMLQKPDPKNSVKSEVAQQYLSNRQEYIKIAKKNTEIYAMPSKINYWDLIRKH